MKISAPAIVLVSLMLDGCASAPILPLPRPAANTGGEVVVFRQHALAAGGVDLAVGADDKAFALLSNDEKTRALLPVGEHEIYVRARSAEPTKVRVMVKMGSTVCLRTSADPNTFIKALVPITLIATGYHFFLDEVPCPPQAELARYRDVLVTYEQ